MNSSVETVVIGTSAGGITALQKLFNALPESFHLPIVVVQHLPQDSSLKVNLVFSQTRRRNYFEAIDKLPLEKDCIYFAPPGYHLLIERNLHLALSQEEPVHFARPSIDVAFQSAADQLGSRVCGVLLTGANSDGAKGLWEISLSGGVTMVQDPIDAESKTMPLSALALFTPSFVGRIEEIAQTLGQLEMVANE